MIFNDLQKDYPYLTAMANYLEDKCFFFGPVLKQIRLLKPDYSFGEDICEKAFILNDSNWKKYFSKAHTIIDFSLEFLQLQIELERTGKYPHSSFQEVEAHVYNNPSRKLSGPWYTWALYFSQFFWVTHNNVFHFFNDDFIKKNGSKGKVLEVPTGTGLFLTYFLLKNKGWYGTGIDIGDSSIDFTRKVLNVFNIPENRVKIVNQDIYKYETREKFDRIICGEFLEHLEDPVKILRKLYTLLKDDGKVFVTAAVWASMVDHIYLYKSPAEVRKQIHKVGFKIENELVQAVFKNTNPEKNKTAGNYCAILTK